MTNFKLFIAILVSVSLTISCSKDYDIEETNDQKELSENFQSDINQSGLLFLDSLEYAKLPQTDISDISSLTGDNEVETRNTRKVLETPPVINQGGEGSCTAFATAYCVGSYFLYTLTEDLYYRQNEAIRSPEYVYNSTKLSGSCDKAGAYLTTVLNFIQTKGSCSWTQMPYNDYNGCNTKPNATQVSQGALGKISSWSRVAANVTSVKQLLVKGYPIVMGFRSNLNFKKETFKTPFIYKSYKDDNDPTSGGHAVTIIGYDDSKQYFIVQNSWGTGYHDKGIFYISYGLFPSIARELYCMVPVFPKDIKIRNASAYGDITFKLNNVNYTIKKGQTLTVPAKLNANSFFIWECVGSNSNCRWDGDYKPMHGTNYKIVDLSTRWDLSLVKE